MLGLQNNYGPYFALFDQVNVFREDIIIEQI